MRKMIALATILLVTLWSSGASAKCTKIQSGTLLDAEGSTISTGFDYWGYNYQARSFHGGFCDAYRDAEWCQDSVDNQLGMKWNRAWLDNKDCDGDSLLDRHYGYPTYIGSGAWLTNHESAQYIDINGNKQRWNYFVKIVAVPSDAWNDDGIWYMEDKKGNPIVIGPDIWGQFAIIMEVYNDTGDRDSHGILYHSPNNSGLGSLTPD